MFMLIVPPREARHLPGGRSGTPNGNALLSSGADRHGPAAKDDGRIGQHRAAMCLSAE